MLQSSLNVIKQHFSPLSQINKNIFQTKEYDYPVPFIQRLYISYLELQELLRTRSSQQIAKRISIVGGRNDKNFQKTLLGFVYAIMLHYTKAKKEENQERQKNLMDSKYDQKVSSQKILTHLTQYFALFRNQTWSLFTNISLELLLNHFNQIKPLHRCGFISIFRHMQKFSVCQDDFFMAIMKTLNFYDQRNLATRYNLELMEELGQVVEMWKKLTESGLIFKQEDLQKNYSRAKVMEQISLMRHYMFGKLVHWQYMAHKMAGYLKGEWPFHLQRTCAQSLKMLKILHKSNPQQCFVFGNEFSRYTQFTTSDYELKQILSSVSQQSHRPIPSNMIHHHFGLVPISLQFLIPFYIEQQINQMSQILYVLPLESGQHPRVERQNVHMIMGWVWKQCLKEFSEESSKSYLIENAFQDLVRWCLMSHTKNLQLRSFIIEWVMYNCMHNEALFKSVKQAFFADWLYYLKIAPQTDFTSFFAILTASLHILNYFVFCAPSLAEALFIYILSKSIMLKTSYQTGVTSEGMFRTYINEVLKKASKQGILRVKEILYQSQLSNFIKGELQIRLQEAENAGIQTLQQKEFIKQPRQLSNDQDTFNRLPKNSISQQLYPQIQKSKYYGDKELELEIEIEGGKNHENSDEDDPIYTSHQFIPSSPTFPEDEEPQYVEPLNESEKFSLEQVEQGASYKRENGVPSHVLEREIEQAKKGNQKLQQKDAFSIQKPIPQTLPSSKSSECLQSTTYQIKLQKEFLEQMGSSIHSLLQTPTVQQFTEYMKQLIKILKEYKKSSQEEEMIEKFLQETAKILYLAFNKEFETFDFSIDETRETRQSRFLSYFLIKSIHQNWKQALTVYNVLVYKKLVKYLCDAFPSCEFFFYFVFLDVFKRGVPNFKEMKPWLFGLEREKIVVPVLQKILGNRFKLHIYENAQILKIH